MSRNNQLRNLIDFCSKDQAYTLRKYEYINHQYHIFFIDIIFHPLFFTQNSQTKSNISPCTIMIKRPLVNPDLSEEKYDYVRRTAKPLRRLNTANFFDVGDLKKEGKQFVQIKSIVNALKRQKQIELVKVGLPHGVNIEISYVQQLKLWVISNTAQTCLVSDQNFAIYIEEIEDEKKLQLELLAKLWINALGKIKNKQTIMKNLCNYTLRGKITRNYQEVIFNCVVHTNSGNLLPPFEARQYLQKMKLKCVIIKSLGYIRSQQKLVSCFLKNTKIIQSQFCQSKGSYFGRASIVFLDSKGDILEGINIPTAEDLIFQKMKELLMVEMEINDKKQSLKVFFDHSIGRSPFPQISYLSLFENIIKMIEALQITKEQVKSNWYKLPKLCLYLLIKRVSIEKFAKVYYEKQEAKSIFSLSYEQFGPIQSKIVTIYYFIHPSLQIKSMLGSKLRKSFDQVDVGFTMIDESKKISQFQLILKGIQKNIHHFYLMGQYPINELKNLEQSLNCGEKNTYYKIVFLNESFLQQTIISQTLYPISWSSIVNYYIEQFKNANKRRGHYEKIQAIAKASDHLHSFGGCEVMTLKNRVPVCLQDLKESAKIKKAIEAAISRKQYEFLLEQIQKMDEAPIEEAVLDKQVSNILKKSYLSLRTICIKAE